MSNQVPDPGDACLPGVSGCFEQFRGKILKKIKNFAPKTLDERVRERGDLVYYIWKLVYFGIAYFGSDQLRR